MSAALLTDTHAHLDMDDFDSDRADVISRASAAGVGMLITVGIDIASSRKAIELSERHSHIYAAAGIHPHDTSSVSEGDMEKLAELARHPRVVAIGETGLDFYRHHAPQEAQIQALKWHLALAEESGKPVIIHCREAEAEMIELLRSNLKSGGQYRGVIHCFSGSLKGASGYLAMGFYLSLGGYVSYPSSRGSYEIIRSIPLGRLLVETDCPFLPPQSYRGKRNEPSYLPLTVKTIAEIRGESFDDIARATSENARRLFRIGQGS